LLGLRLCYVISVRESRRSNAQLTIPGFRV
jgi:hypothetical protein